MHRSRRFGFTLVTAGTLLMASGACATGREPVDPGTGLEVRVLKWPTQPVVREGETDTAPVAGAVVVVAPAAGGKETRASTDTAGLARVRIAAGTYRISVEKCPGAMSLPKEAPTVTVSPGSVAVVSLICDTGIR